MTHLRKTLVVAGHGMVGHRFVQAAVERGLTETYDVVVVGQEPWPAYDRVALTSLLSTERGQIPPETSAEPVVLGATIPVGAP